jgi:hypothetical protein
LPCRIIGSIYYSTIFLIVWEELILILLYMFSKTQQWKIPSPVLFFDGDFLLIKFHCSLLICSDFLFHYSVLVCGKYLGIYQFLLDYPICWYVYIIAHNSLMIFCISVVSVVISSGFCIFESSISFTLV